MKNNETVDDFELRYIFKTPACNILDDTNEMIKKMQLNMEEAHTFHRHLQNCKTTPLLDLGNTSDFGSCFLKDEGQRMGLKSFKVMGGSYAVHKLEQRGLLKPGDTLTTATDGNHGAGVAYVAQQRGYKAVIFVPSSMKQNRRDRITSLGAELRVFDGDYDTTVNMVKKIAHENSWKLISDTSWHGYEVIPTDIATAYTTIFHEAIVEMREKYKKIPTHIFLQVGVGGFAAGGIAYAMTKMDPVPKLVCVEPCDADCIYENIKMSSDGTLPCKGKTESIMAGLNCGTPACTAWPLLRDICSAYIALGDSWALLAMKELYNHKLKIISGESGCAGYAALLACKQDNSLKDGLLLDANSVVLVINTEGATDPEHFNKVITI